MIRNLRRLLRTEFLRSVAWEASGLIGRQLVTVGITLVLARLLTPAEFGLISMSMAFIAMSEIFLDGGFSTAIIQAPEMSQVALNTIFFVNLCLGLVFTLLFWVLAPWIGEYYGSQDVVILTRVLSFTFLLFSLGSVQTSLLRKRMEFRILSSSTIASLFAGGLVAILVVLGGGGVWGLVCQIFLSRGIALALIWYRSRWRPTLEVSLRSLEGHVKFGFQVFLAGLVTRFFAQFHTLVLGRNFDSAMIGQFNRSRSLMELNYKFFTKPFANVFFPYASKLQHQPEALAKRTLGTLRTFGLILSPIAVSLFFNANWLIPALYGPQWGPAIPILRILVFALHVQPVGAITGAVIAGTGHGGRFLLLEASKKSLFVGLQLLGLWWSGLQGYLIGLVVAANMALILDTLALRSTFPVTALRLALEIFGWPALALFLGASAQALSPGDWWLPGLVPTALFLPAYGLCLLPLLPSVLEGIRGSKTPTVPAGASANTKSAPTPGESQASSATPT